MQKAKIMASSPITSWQIDGETMETVTDFILWAPKSLQMETAAMKLKDTCSLEEKLLPTCMHANHFSHVQLFMTMDYSLPGSSVLRILQARILECVSISFSSGSSWPMIEPASVSCIGRQVLYHWRHQETHGQSRQHIRKQRHYFMTKIPLVEATVLPVVLYGCEKEKKVKVKSCSVGGVRIRV